MPSKKKPVGPAAASPPLPPLDPAALGGLGDLMGGLVGGILEQVKQLAGWVGHPLAKALDGAEERLTSSATGGPVSSAEKVRALRSRLGESVDPRLHVVGESPPGRLAAASDDTAGGGSVWVVALGDDRRPEEAFGALKADLPNAGQTLPPCQSGVFWARKWEAPAWSRAFGAGLGGLAEKPLWVKLWDANGALVGPIARAPPALPPLGTIALEPGS